MNLRQQKYKANRLAGMNQYNAARAAGYSEKYSRQACRVEKLAIVSMAESFEQAGVTDKFLIAHALKGLEATKLFGKDGIEGEDWGTRHRYFESICKMTDRLRDKIEHTGKDGEPLMQPIINIYGNKTTTDNRRLHTEEVPPSIA